MPKLPGVFLILTILSTAVYAQHATISDKEALETGHYIDSVTSGGSPAALSHFIDFDSLLWNVQKMIPELNNPAYLRAFRKGMFESIGDFGVRLASAATGGSYRLLKEYTKGGTKHLLFRAYGNKGLNYYDYSLIKVGDTIKASDVFIFTVDENFSSTVSTVAKTMVASSDLKMSETERSVARLKELRDQKAYAAAKDVYDKLDKPLKESKPVQVGYIDICHHLGDSLYEKSLEHFAESFPDAPSTYLMMIDLYYLKKDFAKGLTAVDKLDSIVGKDPFLDLFRGNFCKLSGKRDESLVCYERLYRTDPTLAINTRTLITTYAQAGRYDDGKKVIGEYKKTAGFRQEDLDKLYSNFPSLK